MTAFACRAVPHRVATTITNAVKKNLAVIITAAAPNKPRQSILREWRRDDNSN